MLHMTLVNVSVSYVLLGRLTPWQQIYNHRQ